MVECYSKSVYHPGKLGAKARCRSGNEMMCHLCHGSCKKDRIQQESLCGTSERSYNRFSFEHLPCSSQFFTKNFFLIENNKKLGCIFQIN